MPPTTLLIHAPTVTRAQVSRSPRSLCVQSTLEKAASPSCLNATAESIQPLLPSTPSASTLPGHYLCLRGVTGRCVRRSCCRHTPRQVQTLIWVSSATLILTTLISGRVTVAALVFGTGGSRGVRIQKPGYYRTIRARWLCSDVLTSTFLHLSLRAVQETTCDVLR